MSQKNTLSHARYHSVLITYLRPLKWRVLLLAVCIGGGAGLELLIPKIMKQFIDGVVDGTEFKALTWVVGAFVLVSVGRRVLGFVTAYVGETLGWLATNAMRVGLTKHCLGLDPDFYASHGAGEMVERIDGDVQTLANFFSTFSVQILGSLLLLCGIPVMLLFEHVWIGLGFLVFTVVVMGIMIGLRNVGVGAWTEARKATADMTGYIEEHLSGAEDVRSCGAVPYVLARLEGMVDRLTRLARKAGLRTALIDSGLLFHIGRACALVFGAYLYWDDAITIGTIYLVLHYLELAEGPIFQFSKQIQDLQRVGASLARIEALQVQTSVIVDGSGTDLPKGALGIHFDRVDFAYDSQKVLDDVSFDLAPGRVLGIAGRTGSGKTTLTRLLFRFYDPRSGLVQIGERDLKSLRRDHLRRRVGLVTQEVQLFHGSVRDNLTFFDGSVSDDDLYAGIQALGLTDWYETLPHGLDTVLGEGERRLSAGEAQLLAFVRVYSKDPGLLVLDEASSRLDPATERLMSDAIARLAVDRTVILIAHRLETFRLVDDVLILEAGKVLEFGARKKLAADEASAFYKLLSSGGGGLLS